MFIEKGKIGAPPLVCVPGLLGGPEDFTLIIETLIESFHILIYDTKTEANGPELNKITTQQMREIRFDNTADDIKDLLLEKNIKDVTFLGISLGGKIVYDFIAKFPQLVRAAVITDVGPGPFGNSDLFRFIDTAVNSLNMNQEWRSLKNELKDRIPEQNLRTLIQTQLFYPNKVPPAAWKPGMQNFNDLLQGQSIDNQFDQMQRVEDEMAKDGRFVHVLKAGHLSAIDQSSFEKMKKLSFIKIHPIPEGTHFFHITHKEEIQRVLVSCLK